MSRTISSAQTFLLKFLFTPLWIGGMGVTTVPMFFGYVADRSHPVDPHTKWLYLAVWIVGGLLLYGANAPLKRVSLTDTDLHVSNFRREIVVPLRDIDEVHENRWGGGRHITVRFTKRTEFGHEIVFMPLARPFALFSPNPLVATLRQAAARARLDVK